MSYKERRWGQQQRPSRARATLDSALRRRTSQPAGGRRSGDGGEKIDGLDLSFWVEDADLETSSPKPDYRDRWRNLTRGGGNSSSSSSGVGGSGSDNNSKNNRARVPLKKLINSSAVGDRRSDSNNSRTRVGESLKQHSSEQVTVFGDWGDTLWEEVEQDWGEAGGWHQHQDLEDSLASLSARYLHAWADVARIGARAKTTPAPAPALAPALATEEAEDSAAAGSDPVPSSAERAGPGPLRTPAGLNNYRRRPIKRTRL